MATPQRQQCYEEDCELGGGSGGGGGGGGGYPAGVYMTLSYVPGDYEGFLMGDPEFEIHIMNRRYALDSGAVDVQCIGQHAGTSGNQAGVRSALYAYDQNGATWTGNVMLFSEAQVAAAQAVDSSFAVWMWEDDNGDCKIVRQDQSIADYLTDAAPLLVGGYNAAKALTAAGNLVLELLATGTLSVKAVFSTWQNDDIVGLMVREDVVNQSYADATHAVVHNGSIVGRANIIVRTSP